LNADEIRSWKGKPYPELAAAVLEKFIPDCLPAETLGFMCREAYDYPVPLESVEARIHVMRLDRGPTASFKDFAARMMPG